ncbi:hypothetical protein ILUMI_13841 [Ignelater luminosus]|uniref:Uncharacterized protein n=1 Tax=Ignelater luminosus TaxID=2038154 RepID=A0A8K0G8A7_IGNLU|nr:hypothetical protein ILUMI_13841 [Ignelater luminosus]
MDDLSKIIFDATTQLQNIDLNVLPIVSDQVHKKLFVTNHFMRPEGDNIILMPDSSTVNDDFLKKLDFMIRSPSYLVTMHIEVVDYCHWDNVTEQDGFQYVTDYLARKRCERRSCDLCIANMF